MNYISDVCNESSLFELIEASVIEIYFGSKIKLWLLRVFIVCLLLFLFIGLAKLNEIYMNAIEFIISKKLLKTKQKDGDALAWDTAPQVLENLTLRALGANSFLIFFPIVDLLANKFETKNFDGLFMIAVN
jgi:hypothetical protein